MTRKQAHQVRPGEWLVLGEEAHEVSKVEFGRAGRLTITAPPRPPEPMREQDDVIVAPRPPMAKATWNEVSGSWLVTVYVPDGTQVTVGMERDRREEGDES